MAPETAAQYSDAHSGEPGAAGAAERLNALKKRITDELPDRVRTYKAEWDTTQNKVTGLEALNQMVLDDLWHELDHETEAFARQPDPSWQDQERWALEEFIEHRARGFVGRESSLEVLRELVLSPPSEDADWGASVTGESGSGKSALIAQLHRVLEEEDVLLLAHAAGISLRANQVDAMLLRWIEELAAFLDVSVPVEQNAKPDDIDQAFRSLLTQASQRRRVVVLIDALNQFEPTLRARHVTWLPLPHGWPDNARLITTAIPGTESESVEQWAGTIDMTLPPLSASEAEAIARTICRRYHREAYPEVLRALTEKRNADGTPAAGNPLWLTLAIEELNLLDADDFARADREFTGTPEQRLHQLLLNVAGRLPADITGLCGWMLARSEQLYGEPWARTFANVIAVSRTGWREPDFEALLPAVTGEAWDPLRFAGLRRSFRAQLVQRGSQGQRDFFHVQMREAVLARNLQSEDERKALHSQITDHLETLSNTDPLRATELMFHYIGADDKPRAAHYYGEKDLLPGELTGASQALADHIIAGKGQDPNPGLEWAIGLVSGGHAKDDALASICEHFQFELYDCLEYRVARETFVELLIATRDILTSLVAQNPNAWTWQRGLAISYDKLGDVLLSLGDSSEALASYRAAVDLLECLATHMEKIPIESRLANSDASEDSLEFLASLNETNIAYQKNLLIGRRHLGDALLATGDTSGATEAYHASLAIAERLADLNPMNAELQRELEICWGSIGMLLSAQGDASGALDAYRASLAIAERLAHQDPTNAERQSELAIGNQHLGDVLLSQGDAPGALAAFRTSLTIREHLALRDPTNLERQRDLAICHGKTGDVLRVKGDTPGALVAYRASLSTLERLAVQDATNTVWEFDLSVSHERVGDVLIAQGDASGALQAYRASLAIRERLAHQDPQNAERQQGLSASHERVGDVLVKQGDASGALQAYRASLAIRELLALQDPTKAEWQRGLSVSHNKLGDVSLAQGDTARALNAYRASLAIAERLARQDPTNAGWQRDLSFSHERIGDALLTQGDATGTMTAYRASLAIAERLAHQDPTNAGWQRDLSLSHERIGLALLRQGDAAGALAAFRASLAIAERLAHQDPTNAGWQRDLSFIHERIGVALLAQGDASAARAAYRAALAIVERLVVRDPENAE